MFGHPGHNIGPGTVVLQDVLAYFETSIYPTQFIFTHRQPQGRNDLAVRRAAVRTAIVVIASWDDYAQDIVVAKRGVETSPDKVR